VFRFDGRWPRGLARGGRRHSCSKAGGQAAAGSFFRPTSPGPSALAWRRSLRKEGQLQCLADVINDLRARAAKLLAKSAQINEQETKSALVTPMLHALGWDCEDPDEVRWEYRYTSQDNPVDYALFVGGRPRLFVEAKSLGRDLGDHKWRMQAVNYANAAGVEWCVLTDGNFWQIYKSNATGDLDSKLFLTTCLYPPDGRQPAYEPGYVLSLLSREKLPEDEIETLWTRLNVDRRGAKALQDSLREKDAVLVRLLQKRAGLTKGEVLSFLDRARIAVGSSGATPEPPAPPPVIDTLLSDGPAGASRPTSPSAAEAARKAWTTRRARQALMPTASPVADATLGGDPLPSSTPKLPTQRELEVPLLRAILKRGGDITSRNHGAQIDAELADAFGLDQEQRRARLANRSETLWSNRIRWTRMRLVKKGDLDGSRRGVWALTEQGRRRAAE